MDAAAFDAVAADVVDFVGRVVVVDVRLNVNAVSSCCNVVPPAVEDDDGKRAAS